MAKGKGHRGSLTVTAEEGSEAKGVFTFTAHAEHVDKKDLFGAMTHMILPDNFDQAHGCI